MTKSLDSGASQDTFTESPCNSSTRIFRTKVYHCKHCIKKRYTTVEQKANTFSTHVRQKHPKKVSPEEDGSKWKAKEGRDFLYYGITKKIYKRKKITPTQEN